MVGSRGMMRDRMMGSRMRNIGCRGIGVMVGSRGIRVMVRCRAMVYWCWGIAIRWGCWGIAMVVNDGDWSGCRGHRNQSRNNLRDKI